MMVDENYVKNNFSGKQSFFAVSNQRCFFLEQLNNYEFGELLYVESVVTMVVNFIGAIIAISGNVVILLTFWKSNQLRSQSQLFIWCLAFADFLTGLIVQPFYGAYKIAYMVGHSSASCVRGTQRPFSGKYLFGAL